MVSSELSPKEDTGVLAVVTHAVVTHAVLALGRFFLVCEALRALPTGFYSGDKMIIPALCVT